MSSGSGAFLEYLKLLQIDYKIITNLSQIRNHNIKYPIITIFLIITKLSQKYYKPITNITK